jgi:hypothetical protein
MKKTSKIHEFFRKLLIINLPFKSRVTYQYNKASSNFSKDPHTKNSIFNQKKLIKFQRKKDLKDFFGHKISSTEIQVVNLRL